MNSFGIEAVVFRLVAGTNYAKNKYKFICLSFEINVLLVNFFTENSMYAT
jgi:hypothetical protein